MTIQVIQPAITYIGDGATTQFQFFFALPPNLNVGFAAQNFINVIVTNIATGAQTTIFEGAGAGNWQAQINAPIAPNPTPIGGFITYNPGTPLQPAFSITIERVALPFQNTSFAAQGTLLPTAIELAMDLLTIIVQDVQALQTLNITANITELGLNLNYQLPAVGARANKVLGFDGAGNVTAVSAITSGGTVSGAMTPVVQAATLAAGRTAFGLGSAAVENIGGGLTDDGGGNLIVNDPWTTDTTNQSVAFPAFLGTQRAAQGPITYTLPLTSGVRNGSFFTVFIKSGVVTFAPNGADLIFGQGTGTNVLFQAGTFVRFTTDGAGTWYVQPVRATEEIELEASVASNNLTVTVGNRWGWIKFHDPTIANGDPIWLQIPGSPSITFNSGSTFQQPNNRPFRIWIIGVNNAGVFQLAGFCSFNSPIIGGTATYNLFAINEAALQSSSASGTTAGVYFQGNNAAFTSKAIRVLGYVEYGSGLATAGVFNTTPSRIRVMTPGMKLPGDTGQLSINYQAAASNPAVNVQMESACNLVIINAFLTLQGTTDGGSQAFALTRSGLGGTFAGVQANIGSTNGVVTLTNFFIDFPNSSSTVTYGIGGQVGTQLAGFLSAQEVYA